MLGTGVKAPDFSLPADDGSTVTLAGLKGRKVVLYFYPKDDTPGCTTQACGFRDRYPEIEERNAVVLGISPDGTESHRKFKTKFNLPFILLADEDHAVAEAYGVWGEKTNFGRKYMGVIRSHFVVDEQGRLADVQLWNSVPSDAWCIVASVPPMITRGTVNRLIVGSSHFQRDSRHSFHNKALMISRRIGALSSILYSRATSLGAD